MNAIISNKYRLEIKGLGFPIAGLLEGEFTSDEIIQAFANFYYEKLILDVTSIKNYTDINNLLIELKKIFVFLDPTKAILLLENTPLLNSKEFLSKVVELNIYNFTFELGEINNLLVKPKTYSEILEYANYNVEAKVASSDSKTRVIWVYNVTEHAGATTLIYMMYQELIKHYKVKCLEIDKEDFKYFYNEDLRSIKREQIVDEFLIDQNLDVVLIDANGYVNELLTKETLNIIEPSVLKLNKLLSKDKEILTKYTAKTVILNRTNISMAEVRQFEEESNLKIFDIIRNTNERLEVNPQIMNLLIKLGFTKTNNGIISADDTEKKKSFFDTFK